MRMFTAGVALLLLIQSPGCDGPGPVDPSLSLPDSTFDYAAFDVAGDTAGAPDRGAAFDGTREGGAVDAELLGPEDGGVPIDMAPADAPEVDAAGCLDDTGCEQGLHCHVESGECVECTEFLHCKDDSPCTFDYCSEEMKCAHNPVETDCSDGNSCSFGDHCEDGVCVYDSVVDCDDGNVCTMDTCNAGGDCLNEPTEGACDDGDPCAIGDFCLNGLCQAGVEPADCDDENPCTDDFCEPGVGCAHEPAAGQCDDGDHCTEGDTCEDGACLGQPKVCADGNACTADSCDPEAGCVIDVLIGSPCDDQDICTVSDTCQADGNCLGVDVDCNDGNSCTNDYCSEGGAGCVHTLLDGPECDDGNACTSQDACVAGQCIGVGKVCDDSNPCTADGCDPATEECQFDAAAANGLACDDQNFCTVGDHCSDGQCQAGQVLTTCNDDNVCTEDSCDALAGCVNVALPGAPCDDENQCTSGDHCSAGGSCAGQAVNCDDGDQCTADSCDPDSGCVSTVQTNLGCDDGDACTKNDKCKSSGKCQGTMTFCDDANVCTSDSCNPATGCVHDPLPMTGAQCDDLNACTEGDTCLFGDCDGEEIDCADDDECTTDYCLQGDCVNQPIPGCGVSSCQAHCGQQVGQCFCDAQCPLFNDCCDDVCDFCNYNWCNCEPDCQGKECGSDGCGGTCGECGAQQYCNGGECTECSCGDKECAQDQCGNSCGSCPPGTFCLWMTGECMSW